MTSKEFVVWMQGFVEACNDYSPTPKQWDTLKDKLAKVDDNKIPMGGIIVDHNRFGTITTTPGTTGFVTYNPSSTTYATPQSGSWHYTNTLPQQPTTESNQLELEFETK